MKKKVYENILESKRDLNAWKSDDLFNVNDLSEIDKIKLENWYANEYIVKGTRGDISKTAAIEKSIALEFSRLINDNSEDCILFHSEHIVKSKSKLRSYKKMFNRSDESEFGIIQNEIEIEDNKSFFVSLIPITNRNISLAFCIADSATSFLFFTKDEIVKKAIITNIKSFMNYNSTVNVRYLDLFLCLNDFSCRVIRQGGDGGDDYVSFQEFKKKEVGSG